MEWLSQNWLWLLLAGAAVWYFSRGHRGGMMGGCGGHRMAHEGSVDAGGRTQVDASPPPSEQESSNLGAERKAAGHNHRRRGCC